MDKGLGWWIGCQLSNFSNGIECVVQVAISSQVEDYSKICCLLNAWEYPAMTPSKKITRLTYIGSHGIYLVNPAENLVKGDPRMWMAGELGNAIAFECAKELIRLPLVAYGHYLMLLDNCQMCMNGGSRHSESLFFEQLNILQPPANSSHSDQSHLKCQRLC